MYSPETTSRIAHIRARVVEGTVTPEELAEGVKLMREDRYGQLAAAAAKKAAPKRAAKQPVDVGALFGELDKM